MKLHTLQKVDASSKVSKLRSVKYKEIEMKRTSRLMVDRERRG